MDRENSLDTSQDASKQKNIEENHECSEASTGKVILAGRWIEFSDGQDSEVTSGDSESMF
jgi:hypothetical protein